MFFSPAALVAERFRGINYGKLTEVNYSDSTTRQYTKGRKYECVFFLILISFDISNIGY